MIAALARYGSFFGWIFLPFSSFPLTEELRVVSSLVGLFPFFWLLLAFLPL
jgi:hypothetical protein